MMERDLQKVRAAGFTVIKCCWTGGRGTIRFVDPQTPKWKILYDQAVSKAQFHREISNVLSGRTIICIEYISR